MVLKYYLNAKVLLKLINNIEYIIHSFATISAFIYVDRQNISPPQYVPILIPRTCEVLPYLAKETLQR